MTRKRWGDGGARRAGGGVEGGDEGGKSLVVWEWLGMELVGHMFLEEN